MEKLKQKRCTKKQKRNSAKTDTEKIKGVAKERSLQLKILLETLQVQLALGKAEGKENFETQQKKITKALNEIETFLKKNKTANEYYTKFLMEAGKFRIKLDILRLRYELNKLQSRVKINDTKKDLAKKINDIKKRLLNNKSEVGWEHFKDEISDAYSHFKKAFAK